MMMVNAALNNSAISRLKHTWAVRASHTSITEIPQKNNKSIIIGINK